MRAHRAMAAAVIFLMVAAGCGSDPVSETAAGDLLYLRTSSGVSLVKAGATSPTFQSVTAEPAPDWDTVVRSEWDRAEGKSNLVAVDPVTDETLWERSIPGRMRVKIVSPEARFVALAPDTGRYLSQPGQTRLVVTGRDVPVPTTIDLDGNFEPEAFSVDGQDLFVVQYLPAGRPTRYQVRRVEISTGKIQDVFSVDAELQEAMRGTARVQEMSPDGTRLYTLYSVNTPDGRQSFVHVLSLDELWAHCIDLPDGFALSGAKRSAVGVSPDGERIYVADTAEGMVAELDAQELTVSLTAELDLVSAFRGADVTVAADGASVFVAAGAHMSQLSTEDLSELRRWSMPVGITGIQVGSDSDIYVGTRDEVAVINTRSGKQTDILEPAGAGSITSLGPVTRGLDRARTRLTGVKG